MQSRITRFKMKPDSSDEARALMEDLKGEIMGKPGMRHCLIVMNADGAGYVISAIDPVRALWHKFADHLEAVPAPEIFEVIADWSA